MRTMPDGRLGAVALPIFVIIVFAMAAPPTGAESTAQAFQGREKAMGTLAQDSAKIVETLETLNKEQRNAVMALLTVTRAAAAYESRFVKKDDPPLRTLYRSFSQFATTFKAPAKFQAFLNTCFDASLSCATAEAKCRGGGKKVSECDRDPGVMESCANEAICMTEQFMKLHQALPPLLGGQNPWPPQDFPFPY